jgi:aryl-alcohol dehydrogenase-like predicted oxidoreductase
MTALEASLRRLKTDWIDLYQLHMPDPATPMAETLRALDDAVTQGKVRYIGCCNLPSWQLVDAAWISQTSGRAGFVSTQNEYSLLARDVEKDILPAARAFGMGFLPFFPLASGMLTGKYRADAPPPPGTRFATTPRLAKRYSRPVDFERVSRLTKFAAERDRTTLELACSWLACQPAVASVIAGATSAAQVVQNAAAADWVLTGEELAEIDRLLAEA